MRRARLTCLTAAALAAASMSAIPAASHAAAPQYLTEARCLGVYEAGFHIFSQIDALGAGAGAGALIAGAVYGAAKMSYEQTIDAVIARDDMDEEELTRFRDTHFASSDIVMDGYTNGELDLFDTGQLIYACDVELGYTEEELG